MPTKAMPPAHIFEDPEESTKSKRLHGRVGSVGNVLRGRKVKEEETHARSQTPKSRVENQPPLSERHINSPPQPRTVPLKDDTPSRPIHKKTNSAISLKDFMRSKSTTTDNGSLSPTDEKGLDHKPKKTKSSSNLSGLLRKRSKKELRTDTTSQSPRKENEPPPALATPVYTPIWAQHATQPITTPDGRVQHPRSPERQPQHNIYGQGTFKEAGGRSDTLQDASPLEIPPPKRPFLEHRPSSRSSIFKEQLDSEIDSTAYSRTEEQKQNSSRPSSSRVNSSIAFEPSASTPLEQSPKRTSRVWDVVTTFNRRVQNADSTPAALTAQPESPLSPQELDSTFEKVLDSLNIPHNMRDNMRKLKPEVKVGLIKGDRIGSGSSTNSTLAEVGEVRASARSSVRDRPKSKDGEEKERNKSRSRSRPRSRILTMGKRDDGSPTKKDGSLGVRSKSRPRSIDMASPSKTLSHSASTTSLATPDSATTPGDFIHYLREVRKPELVEVGKLHKLRILLRNETVSWTNAFVNKGGLDELVQLLERIMKVEWREEHEDNLLHENLLCLKALCTTSLALERLASMEDHLFPAILGMLFDEERKGPSEFATRGIIISLLLAHLSAARNGSADGLRTRADKILSFLRDPSPEEAKQPLGFITQMHVPRPYKVWCREVVNVTKEVFWIFLHHLNVVPVIDITEGAEGGSFEKSYFPGLRAPHPAAPYVGGVEWEATQYLATHLDLLNGLIVSMSNREERNRLREDLKQSGWEKAMGGTLRTCKEKFYGGVHDGLKLWVAAAKADGWSFEDVRAGPPREAASPRKSPTKRKQDEAPKIALDVQIGAVAKAEDSWL